AVLVAPLAEPMEGTGLDRPHLHIAAARAGHAIRPATRYKEFLAVIFGLEPSEEFIEFHGAEYTHSTNWCQVSDNRHRKECKRRGNLDPDAAATDPDCRVRDKRTCGGDPI